MVIALRSSPPRPSRGGLVLSDPKTDSDATITSIWYLSQVSHAVTAGTRARRPVVSNRPMPGTEKTLQIRSLSAVRYRYSRRGVSPIIATILLVAITVVLAAVLYVVISGLSHGPGSAPIGSAFAVGTPVQGTCWAVGVTNHVCGTAGDRIFNLSIQQSTITLGDVLLEVRTATGSVFHNTVAGGFAIMPLTGNVPVAYYSFAAGAGLAMSSTFTIGTGYSASSPITSTMFIVVGTGTPTGSWFPGQGNYIVAVGTHHFSGVTEAVVLP